MENEEIQMNSPNRRDDQKAFILKERICDMHKYGKKIVDRFPGRDKELASEIRQSMLTMYRLVVKIEKKYCKSPHCKSWMRNSKSCGISSELPQTKIITIRRFQRKINTETRSMTRTENSSQFRFLRLFRCTKSTCGIRNF